MRLPIPAMPSRLMVNAGALMLSSVATGVLGLAYWIIAGRLFDAAEVGRASALISTATMLSSLACLSLGGSYERFLPLAGHHTRRVIAGGYALTGFVALLLGSGFAMSGVADRLLHTGTQRLLFPVVVVVFTMFALSDPVLTGLGRAPAVAAKNILASVVKIVPLALIGAGSAAMGIVASWTGVSFVVATLFMVVALRYAGERRLPSSLPPVRELLGFQGVFLLMMMVSAALPLLLPLIIVARLGTAENAYFNLAWTMCTAAGLLRGAISAAFIVEASAPGADRPALLRRVFGLYGGAAVCAGVGLALGGPIVLAAAGSEYLRAAWPLMVIMGVVSIAEAVVVGYYSIAQLVRRLRWMLVTQVLIVALTLTGTALLVPCFGITGVGLAVAIAMAVALAVIAVPLRTDLALLRSTPPDRVSPDQVSPDQLSPAPIGAGAQPPRSGPHR